MLAIALILGLAAFMAVPAVCVLIELGAFERRGNAKDHQLPGSG